MISTFANRLLASSLRIGPSRDVGLIAVLAGTAAILFVAYVARMHAVTHDVFHEMALIRAWFESGEFPRNDVFAYTPTVSPAVHHEWGTGLVLYWASAASPLGLDGLIAVKFALIGALGVLLYRVARNAGSHPLLIVCMLPIMLPMLWVGFATVRAQLFTLVALAAQMLMLQSDWRGRRWWIFLWIPMYVVWLNLHAGFVVGLGMLAFHGCERTIDAWYHRKPIWERVWHLFALVPVVGLGLLCNPWGIEYAPYLMRAITMPRPTILEWKPIWYTYDPLTTMIAFSISMVMLGYVAKVRRWSRLRGWLFCALAAYMALKHIRHGSLYAVVFLALMPGWLTPTPLGRSLIAWLQGQRSGAIKSAGYLALGCSMFAIWNTFWQVSLPTTLAASSFCFPKGAVDYLKSHSVQGNILTPFHCGAYVSWEAHPNMKVSIDGRYEVAFAEAVMPEHQCFYDASPGWQEMLDRYDHDFILIPQDSAVRPHLVEDSTSKLAGWRIAYQDDSYAMLARTDIEVPYVDLRK
jgi:hypothetical protein